MEAKDWFTIDAFKRNERFLRDGKETRLRLARLEYRLRCLLEELERYDKSLILGETGLHGGVCFRTERRTGGERAIRTRDGEEIVPIQDPQGFSKVYLEFASVISSLRSIDLC